MAAGSVPRRSSFHRVACVVLLAGFAHSVPSSRNASEASAFEAFMQTYGKVYMDEKEAERRFSIFSDNLATIEAHNRRYHDGEHSFFLGINEFADLTWQEFRATRVGQPNLDMRRAMATAEAVVAPSALPDAVDWVAKGAVTAVQNQGRCGDCWAFSATGSVEGAVFLHGSDHKLIKLSEQELVECDKTDMGCNGGEQQKAFQHFIDQKGACTFADYPDSNSTKMNGTAPHACRSSQCKTRVPISSYRSVVQNNETALREVVATVGPVSVSIDADTHVFQFYKAGVFDGACGNSPGHGVLIVGYGVQPPNPQTAMAAQDARCSTHPACVSEGFTGNCCPHSPGDMFKCCMVPVPNASTPYWTVKNSWGATWGEHGYVRLRRNVVNDEGMCGLAIDASYAIV